MTAEAVAWMLVIGGWILLMIATLGLVNLAKWWYSHHA